MKGHILLALVFNIKIDFERKTNVTLIREVMKKAKLYKINFLFFYFFSLLPVFFINLSHSTEITVILCENALLKVSLRTSLHWVGQRNAIKSASECLSAHIHASIIWTDLLTTTDKAGVGSSISLNVLIEFIITSGNSIASCPSALSLTEKRPRTSLHHLPTRSVTYNLSLSLSLCLSPHSGFHGNEAHTDLIRQPCNDEICTTGPFSGTRDVQ